MGARAVQIRSGPFFGTTGDNAGFLLSGGTAYFYQVGTSTAQAVYTQSNKSGATVTSVALNSGGSFATEVYFDGTLKIEVFDADGVKQDEFLDDTYYVDSYPDSTYVNATDYGDGSLTEETFQAAITAVGANNKVILLKTGAWTFNSNITAPSNVTVMAIDGTAITITTGVTATINGPVDFPLAQVFTLQGTGSVTFGTNVSCVDARWFNVDNTNTNDSQPGAQAAIDSITEGSVFFPSGDYRIDDHLVINKHNIHLISDATCNFKVPTNVTTTSGYGIKFEATGAGILPINCGFHNIFVDIATNGGGNTGGILFACSYCTFINFGTDITGDNLIGFKLQTDDAGTGPYYNTFINPKIQGDSTSGTPLTGTIGIDLAASPSVASRCPNTNTFHGGRVSGVYDHVKIRGAGNRFNNITHETTNQYTYWLGHETVSSGAIRNVVYSPYIEQSAGATAFYCQTNASGNVFYTPYTTGITTVFNDQSTLKNNRFVDATTLPSVNAFMVKACGYITPGTAPAASTVDAVSFNVASVAHPVAGKFQISFTTAMSTTKYHVSAVAVGTGTNGLSVRSEQLQTGRADISFHDSAGTLTDPDFFTFTISEAP